MAVTFVIVPQWQGSGSSRAMRLVDGAEAIRGDLPAASTRSVTVPLEAGDDQGTGVHRLSSIALVRDRLTDALSGIVDPALIVGGDCAVDLAGVSHALTSTPGLAVVWLDAHPDLNTPESSPSHAFSGMVLRTLLGDGPAQLVPQTVLAPNRLVLAGARSFDPHEDDYIAAHSVPVLAPAEVSGESLIAAVEATGATSVYVHLDLDVLDPVDFAGLSNPEPFGIRAADLIESLKALLGRFPLAGAAVVAFAPASPSDAVNDMPTVLRIVGALANGG